MRSSYSDYLQTAEPIWENADGSGGHLRDVRRREVALRVTTYMRTDADGSAHYVFHVYQTRDGVTFGSRPRTESFADRETRDRELLACMRRRAAAARATVRRQIAKVPVWARPQR